MGLFAVIGAQQTLNAAPGRPSAASPPILVGCISAFGGAVMRDLLAGETPQLVLPGPINYLAAILGAVIYVGMVEWAGIDHVVSEWVAIAIVFGLRMIALKYGIKAPEPVDVPHHLTKRVLGGRRRARRPGVRVYHADLTGRRAPGRPGPSTPPEAVPPPPPETK